MKLEQHINWYIYNYPGLSRLQHDHAGSRLFVLNTLFFTIGTGYEWDKRGFLVHHGGKRKRQILKSLPDGFFEKKLWEIQVRPDAFDNFIKHLGDRFHYVVDKSKSLRSMQTMQVVFEAADDADAKSFKSLGATDWSIHKALIGSFEHFIPKRSPYPLSDYSALVEIYNGKSFEGVEFTPKPDWLAGCIEAAVDAVNYFNDYSRYKRDSYYPTQTITRWKYDDTVALGEGDPPSSQKCFKAGETMETAAARIWQDYVIEQIGILQKFLTKFPNKTPA